MFSSSTVDVVQREQVDVGLSATNTQSSVRVYGLSFDDTKMPTVVAGGGVRFSDVRTDVSVPVFSTIARSTQRLESFRESLSDQGGVQIDSSQFVGSGRSVDVVQSEQWRDRKTAAHTRLSVMVEHQSPMYFVSRLVGLIPSSGVGFSPLPSLFRSVHGASIPLPFGLVP